MVVAVVVAGERLCCQRLCGSAETGEAALFGVEPEVLILGGWFRTGCDGGGGAGDASYGC